MAVSRSSHRLSFWQILMGCLGCVLGLTFLGLFAVSPAPLPSTLKDQEVCSSGFKGILLIQQGDREGAAGTIFYLFVLNQLLYAQRHHLLPWIHLSPYSHHVHDAQVHGNTTVLSQAFVTMDAWDQGPAVGCPHSPAVQDVDKWRLASWNLVGSGVWTSYFRPVGLGIVGELQNNPLPPHITLPECLRTLPIVTLTAEQILYGIHLQCPWSVRAWRYGGLLPALRKPELTLHDWLGPSRQLASAIVQSHYRWRPDLRASIDAITAPWWQPSSTLRQEEKSPCLGLHIRHSDKANKRRKIPARDFFPYLQVYAQTIPHGHIYLATDAVAVVDTVRSYADELGLQLQYQPNIVRSNDTTPVFTQASHDLTNRQVLIDIGALSRCTFLLHGLSAVSEAAIYHNLGLHNRSINLEVPSGELVSPSVFEQMILRWEPLG